VLNPLQETDGDLDQQPMSFLSLSLFSVGLSLGVKIWLEIISFVSYAYEDFILLFHTCIDAAIKMSMLMYNFI
jgi:hypothetical protein